MADRSNGDLFAQERHHQMCMEQMSKMLLKALWREHPDQLRFAMSKGRKVERP